MPLKLEEADIAADFDALIACQWASFEDPYQRFFRLFCPILGGPGPAARAEALQKSTNNQRDWLHADPTSYWQKVTDTETGEIVGGALWKICPTNPFEAADEHFEAYWYPEGGQRDFITKALEQFEAPRKKLGRRPQLFLNILFTHPSHRHRGAGTSVLEWGIRKAAALNLPDLWIDATPAGVPLYRHHGFTVVQENHLRPVREPGSRDDGYDEEWGKVERELLPITMWVMWRPVGGPFVEGETVKPWEG